MESWKSASAPSIRCRPRSCAASYGLTHTAKPRARSPRRSTRKGIPGPSGGTWGPSTINGNASRGTGILNNELYVGKLVWNRLKYVKNPNTGKRQSRLNPPEAWIIKDVPELRIVPQELWDAVKARQARWPARPGRIARRQTSGSTSGRAIFSPA